jgi:hypothetical protein
MYAAMSNGTIGMMRRLAFQGGAPDKEVKSIKNTKKGGDSIK